MVAVPEDFLLFDKAMTSQTQPETSIFHPVYVPSPDVGLVASGVTPDRTDRLRGGGTIRRSLRPTWLTCVSTVTAGDSGLPIPHDIV